MGEIRGLRCNIYRPAHGNYSNGGLSSRVDQVTLVGPEIHGPFAPSEDAPAVELRRLGGVLNAKPVDDPRWWMFGGCFIYTSDSRFPSNAPIALHDRTETSEESELLSR